MQRHCGIALALALALPWAASPSLAAEACADASAWPDNPSRLGLRMDNDAFGSAVQDHGYSNGLMLTVVSPDLVGDGDPACDVGVGCFFVLGIGGSGGRSAV